MTKDEQNDRECERAALDLLMYGTGVFEIDRGGNAKHVPIGEFRAEEAARSQEKPDG